MSQIPPSYPAAAGLPPAYPAPMPPGAFGSMPVASDMPCRKCGYNLRGLSSAGRCPECGTPVGLSVQGDLLRFSEPKWVRKLQRGGRLIIAGILIIFFASLIGSFLKSAIPSSDILMSLVVVAGYIVEVVGAWLITEPDPSGIGEDRYGTLRKVIRFALIVGIANTVLNFGAQTSVVAPELRQTLLVVAALAALIGLVGQIVQLKYLSRIALRIPDESLSSRANFLMYGIGISYGVMIILGLVAVVIAAAAGGGRMGQGMAVFGVLGCGALIALLALIVFVVMYLFMLDRMSKRFGAEADAAEATWAGSAAA